MVFAGNFVGRAQSFTFIFDFLFRELRLRSKLVRDEKSFQLAQANLYRRRTLDFYEFESGHNENNSCPFRHFSLSYHEYSVDCTTIKEISVADYTTDQKSSTVT